MSSTVASLGMLIVLEIAPREERLRRRHHPDVAHVMDEARALLAALVGGVEDGQVLVLEVRRALDRLRAADVLVGRVDLARG